jgi:hypothetical protein
MCRHPSRPTRALLSSPLLLAALLLALPTRASAQWKDPKLIAGQVGFHVAVSFFGKLVLGHEPAGQALKKALIEGSAAGALSHAGYSLAGSDVRWMLAGKALTQKAGLTTRRSMNGEPVFDRSLATHWELTHSFVHVEWKESPRASIDVLNAAFSAYYLASPDHDLDPGLSLATGSLTFRHRDPPERLLGFYVPGAIWFDETRNEGNGTLRHEIIHSLQAERGSAIDDLRFGPHGMFRLNYLAFASGVPALLAGWPAHDDRVHEFEADAYSGQP